MNTMKSGLVIGQNRLAAHHQSIHKNLGTNLKQQCHTREERACETIVQPAQTCMEGNWGTDNLFVRIVLNVNLKEFPLPSSSAHS